MLAFSDRQILSYQPFQGDETDVTVLSDRMVITRKPHRCQHCWQEFQAGARARSLSERNNEDHLVGTFYFCPRCCIAMGKCVTGIDYEALHRRFMRGERN